MGLETYQDPEGTERCDNCDAEVNLCDCYCTDCGDLVIECGCPEGPSYPVVANWGTD